MTNNKIILGFTGLPASGKGTVAQYLAVHYGAGTYRYSTILSDVLQRLHLEQTRDNQIRLSESVRATFGEDILARAIAKDAQTDERPLIVVEGIRRMADIEHLARLPNFVLVEIFADLETRYQRMIKRSEKADDAGKTLEEFKADHQRSTELSIPKVVQHASERINNNGSLNELHEQLDLLVKKYGNKN